MALQAIKVMKRFTVRYNPWEDGAKWAKELFERVKTTRNVNLNPKCEISCVTTDSKEPAMAEAIFIDGSKLTFGANETLSDVLDSVKLKAGDLLDEA